MFLHVCVRQNSSERLWILIILALSGRKCHFYKFKKVGRCNNISCNNERLSLLNKNFPTEIIAFNTILKLNPITRGDFAEKCVLKPLELKLTTKPFTGCTPCSLLTQMQNIQLAQFIHAQKPKLFGFKSDTTVLTYFLLSLLPSFFGFLVSVVFSCLAFSRLHFGGKKFVFFLVFRLFLRCDMV